MRILLAILLALLLATAPPAPAEAAPHRSFLAPSSSAPERERARLLSRIHASRASRLDRLRVPSSRPRALQAILRRKRTIRGPVARQPELPHRLTVRPSSISHRRLALLIALSRRSANRNPTAPRSLLRSGLAVRARSARPALGLLSDDRLIFPYSVSQRISSRQPSLPFEHLLLQWSSSRTALPSSSRPGLTLDPCSSDSDCVSPRTCLWDSVFIPCPTGEASCVCLLPEPNLLTICASSSDCPPGEVCGTLNSTEVSSFCVSAEVVEGAPELQEVGTVPTPNPSPTQTPPEAASPPMNGTDPSSGGLTGDICESIAECVSDRVCLNPSAEHCAPGDTVCFCFPRTGPTMCTSSTDCVPGEICAELPNVDPICVSEQTVESSAALTEVNPVNTTLPSPSPLPSSRPTDGFTGDPCLSNGDCLEGRTCHNISSTSSCSEGLFCFCFPQQLTFCFSSEECVPGEVCASMEGVPSTFCVSEQVEDSISDIVEVNPGNNTVPSVAAVPTPSQSAGLTLDDCSTNVDCIPDRTCEDRDRRPCSEMEFCFCMPPVFVDCETSADCVLGEICVTTGESRSVCVSQQVEQDVDGITEVDADASPEADDPLEPIAPSPIPPSGGFTGDVCESDADCLGDRSCTDTIGACPAGAFCICAPPVFVDCSSSAECVEGEVCASLSGQTVCVSQQLEQNADGITEVDPDVTSASGTGLTGDRCESDFECSGERSCLVRDNGLPCSGDDLCICVPSEIVVCDSNADCVVGEACAAPSTSVSTQGICLSEEVVNNVDELHQVSRAAFMSSHIGPAGM